MHDFKPGVDNTVRQFLGGNELDQRQQPQEFSDRQNNLHDFIRAGHAHRTADEYAARLEQVVNPGNHHFLVLHQMQNTVPHHHAK